MRKLMKYEFRKTAFSKIVLLIVTAVAELAYLAGVFLEWDDGLEWGIIALAICAIVGIFYIGIESLVVFHRDLNTKQSYMLFLTPHNSFQILGAKVLENGISILAAGVCFAALAAVDFTIATIHLGGVKMLLEMINNILDTFNMDLLTQQDVLLLFFAALSSWLMMVTLGFLAITLSATVLAGKRFSGLASFLLYFAFNTALSYLTDYLPVLEDTYLQNVLLIAVMLAVSAALYAVTGWIMEKKLSV